MTGSEGKLVLVGLAGLDWRSLQARAAARQTPRLAELMARGTAGPLLSHAPPAEIAAWGTLATGLPPEGHGLVTRDEPWAGGLRAAGRQSWRSDPAWLRLVDAGIHTASVAWPATAPGRSWPGVHVDDRFPVSNGWGWGDWPLPRGVSPDDWRDDLRDTRVHVSNVTGAMLQGLVPAYEQIDQSRDHRLIELARQLSEFSTTHAATQLLMEDGSWDALFLRNRMLEQARLRFGRAAAPYQHVVDGAWALIDALVGDLAGAVGRDATLLIVSPGFAGHAGAFLATGPGAAQGHIQWGGTTIDVAPTVYAHFGYGDPALRGRLLIPARGKLASLPAIRARPDSVAADPADLARVNAFGLALPPPPLEQTGRRLLAEAELLIARDPQRTAELAERAASFLPRSVVPLGLRAAAHVAAQEVEPLSRIADQIEERAPGHLWADLIRAGYFALRGDAESAAPLLSRIEREGGPDERMRAAAAWLMLERPLPARRLFEKLSEDMPDSIAALLGLASTGLPPRETEALLRKALDLDPGHEMTRTALAQLLRGTGRSREAEALQVPVT